MGNASHGYCGVALRMGIVGNASHGYCGVMLRGRRGGVAMREGGWGSRYPICRQKLRDVVSNENSPNGQY